VVRKGVGLMWAAPILLQGGGNLSPTIHAGKTEVSTIDIWLIMRYN